MGNLQKSQIESPQNLQLPFAAKETPPDIFYTVWPAARPDQKHVAHGGETQKDSWVEFCEWVEYEHAKGRVYAKGRGPQWAPVGNKDGHRCIASTASIHALVLDCDDGGDWDQILGYLGNHGAAYCAYRSPGHTEEKPKWRLVLPFSSGVISKDDPRQINQKWRHLYDHARETVEALSGVEFDPTTKDLARVYYLGHRRTADTPRREVRWSDGHPVDVQALSKLLRVPTKATRKKGQSGGTYTGDLQDGDTISSDVVVATESGSSGSLKELGEGLGNGDYVSVYCPHHGDPTAGASLRKGTNGNGLWLTCFSDCSTTWRVEDPAPKIEVETLDLASLSFEEELPDELEEEKKRQRAIEKEIQEQYADRLERKRQRAWDASPMLAERARAILKEEDKLIKSRDGWRGDWRRAGMTKTEGCSTLTQAIVKTKGPRAGQTLFRGLHCDKTTCVVCGPIQAVRKTLGAISLPLIEGDQFVGRALVDRPVYLKWIPVADVNSFKRAFTRPPKPDDFDYALAHQLKLQGHKTADIASTLGVSRATIKRKLARFSGVAQNLVANVLAFKKPLGHLRPKNEPPQETGDDPNGKDAYVILSPNSGARALVLSTKPLEGGECLTGDELKEMWIREARRLLDPSTGGAKWHKSKGLRTRPKSIVNAAYPSDWICEGGEGLLPPAEVERILSENGKRAVATHKEEERTTAVYDDSTRFSADRKALRERVMDPYYSPSCRIGDTPEHIAKEDVSGKLEAAFETEYPEVCSLQKQDELETIEEQVFHPEYRVSPIGENVGGETHA